MQWTVNELKVFSSISGNPLSLRLKFEYAENEYC